ncbi:hypothetical protein BGZ58_002003 [Dissophora ornata]|nr:hypothetical protein BGZ58_002003 [Dissophora ornata]
MHRGRREKTCADVTIVGVKSGKLPSEMRQVYDFKGVKQGKTFPGDGHSQDRSSGLIKGEITANTRKS